MDLATVPGSIFITPDYTYDAGALDQVTGGGTVHATFSDYTSLGQPGSVTYGRNA